MPSDKLVSQVEKRYLSILVHGMKSKKCSLKTAREKTKSFLALLPFATYDDVSNKISGFVNEHSEFKKLWPYCQNEIEREKTKHILQKLNSLGSLDNAHQTLQSVIKMHV